MSTFDHAAYRAAELRLHEAAVEYARVGGGVALSNLAGVAREYAKATPALLFTEQEADRNAELSREHYDHGGDMNPGAVMVTNTTGQPIAVIPDQPARGES